MAIKKRDRKMIVIGFSASVAIFVIVTLFSLIYIYPEILRIETLKADFSTTIKDYNTLKQSGFNFKEFSSLIKKTDYQDTKLKNKLKDSYTSKILAKVDENFYSSNFKNETSDSFPDFLSKKEQEIASLNVEDEFKEKEESISSIIPIYTDENEFKTDNSLTTLKFINYVENLVFESGLSTNSPIGVKEVYLVGDENNTNTQKKTDDSLEADIYYIPIKLNLQGKKSKIIDFLNNIYNSGIVAVDEKGDLVFQDQKKRHLAEVWNLEMSEYIDNSTIHDPRYNDKNIEELIKATAQSDEEFEISLELRFYVTGLPSYQFKEEITKVLLNKTNGGKEVICNLNGGEINSETQILVPYNYLCLKSEVSSLLKNKEIVKATLYREKIANFESYFSTDLDKKIKALIKEMNTTNNLESVYKDTLKYKEIFLRIYSETSEIKTKLNIK